MRLVEQLKEQLVDLPATVLTRAGGLTVPAASTNGFDVSITIEDDRFDIFFDQWHYQSFSASEEAAALQCFADCLSDKTRLVVDRRGNMDFRWSLEENQAGVWHSRALVSKLLYPFWRPRHSRYLQNNLNVLGPNNSFKSTPLCGTA